MKNRLKILFVLQTLRTGGSERIVKELSENLSAEKFEPYVLSLTDGEMHQEFLDMGISTSCVHKKGKDTLDIVKKISRYIKANGITLINAHHLSPFVHAFFAAKLNRCRLLYTAHTCQEVDLLPPFWAALGRYMLKACDGAIGISNDISDSMHAKFGLSNRKIFTIENAINISRFEIEIDLSEKKRELGFADGDRIIGSVGSLGQQKNYPNLIRAFKIIKEKMDNVRLLIIGEGKRRPELQDLIESLGLDGHAVLAGARLDVPELMQIMDVYCLASDFEGIPLTMLEAMAATRAIVGTDVIGIRDIVENGKTGLLVPPNDSNALSQALIEVLQSDALSKKLSANAHRYVHEKHSTQTWIEQYEQLFSQIANNRKPSSIPKPSHPTQQTR